MPVEVLESEERLRELDALDRDDDSLAPEEESLDGDVRNFVDEVVERSFAGFPPVCVVLLRMSELIIESRLKTSDRCSAVTSDTFANRDRKSLTFFEYPSAPVAPIAETDLTSFSKAVSSAIIDRAVAAVTASEFKAAAAKQAARTNRVQILILNIPQIDGVSKNLSKLTSPQWLRTPTGKLRKS